MTTRVRATSPAHRRPPSDGISGSTLDLIPVGLSNLVWVPKNLDSSASALGRSSGTAVLVYEAAEHGFGDAR
jgi:hypothetical protein